MMATLRNLTCIKNRVLNERRIWSQLYMLRNYTHHCLKYTTRYVPLGSSRNLLSKGICMHNQWDGSRFYSSKRPEKRNIKSYSKTFIEFSESLPNKPKDFSMSCAEWEILEKAVIADHPRFAKIIDSAMMKTLGTNSRSELALSWMRYIRSRRTPNLVTIAEFMAGCCKTYPDLVVDEWRKLEESKSFSQMDTFTLRTLIQVLSYTSEWRCCIQLLQIVLQKDGFSVFNYHFMVDVYSAALRNKDYEMYYRLLNNRHCIVVPSHWKRLMEECFIAWQQEEINLDVYLELQKVDKLYCSKQEADTVYKYCKSGKWGEVKTKFVTIPNDSVKCNMCGSSLRAGEITTAEFSKLSTELLNRVLIGENIYRNTHPEELQSFLRFMDREGPFHCVIDGLNVILNGRSKANHWHKLRGVISCLIPNKWKILVIVRKKFKNQLMKNMLSYNKNYTKFITLYDLDHSSSDDLFVLLGAIHSGPQTYILTNDNLRNHRFCLKSDLQPIFTRWQNSRQISHRFIWNESMNNNASKAKVQMPVRFDAVCQDYQHGWHVPYLEQENVEQWNAGNWYYATQPNTFLCIRKDNYKPTVQLLELRSARKRALKNPLDFGAD